jgi:antitoxin VapB
MTRTASLFRNGRSQAVRIPREFEFSADQVRISREGESLVLTPVHHHRLLDVIAGWAPLPEGLPEPVDPLPRPVRL